VILVNYTNIDINLYHQMLLTPADVSSERWDTNIPRLIDDAIIGLSKFDPDEFMEKIKSL